MICNQQVIGSSPIVGFPIPLREVSMPRGRKPVSMPKVPPEIIKVNEAIVYQLHKKKVDNAEWDGKDLARPSQYLDRLLSAVRRVQIPIPNSTTEEVETNLRALGMSRATKFWTVQAVNEALAFVGKPGMYNPPPKRSFVVTYIPLEKLLKKLELLEEPFRLYLGALAATGCRYGELPEAKLDGDWVFVNAQVVDDGRVTPTKNKKPRHAAILPILKPLIMAYKALPYSTQVDLRLTHYHRLYGASKRILGVSIHTLRHTYAIECAKLGKSAQEIAGYIGDTVIVTEKHYLGYIKPTKSPWP